MSSVRAPEVLNINGVTVVRPGEDFANLYESLLDHLQIVAVLGESIHPPRLIFDMQSVRFIGSAFLGRMIAVNKLISARPGGRFALCNASPFCAAAMSISKLHSFLKLYGSLDEAVAALSADA